MRSTVVLNMTALLLCSVGALAAAGEDPSPARRFTSNPNELWRELLELRLEVCRQGIEFQDWKIRLSEDYLEQARAEHRRLEDEERNVVGELTSADGETGEVGARRADLSAGELPRLGEQKRIAEARMAELGDQLAKERERRSVLVERANQAAASLKTVTGP